MTNGSMARIRAIGATERPRVGVDIGGTKMLLVAVDGAQRLEHRVATGPQADPARIEREVAWFLEGLGAAPLALGVAVPALADGDGRVAESDVLPKLAGWRPADAFARFGCPVATLNDADAALVEEAHDLRPGATAAIVMAGTAVGAAFRVDGRPLRGARGWAGELGYLPVPAREGGVAALAEVAGGAAVAARLGVDGAALRALADRGDPAALGAIRDAGEALGLGLAAVVNLLNPELLVLGGGACSLPGYATAAVESAALHALPALWEACTVRPARAGEAVVALGAARAAMDAAGPDSAPDPEAR